MGAFSASDRIRIMLELRGAQQYVARMWESAKATQRLALAQKEAAASTATLRKQSLLHNQMLYTGRRLMFYGTLGALALGGSIVKLGFSYQSMRQQAEVALDRVIKPHAALNTELNKLFRLAALTPFQFKDVVTGFTTMYKAAMLTGHGVAFVNRVMVNVSDALSAVPGKATSANLNRVTTALQHMLNLGRPTGQVLLQLARLGIPIEAILRKQLNLTDQQIRNISKSGITAVQVLNAFNKFVETTPGFQGQAFATQTRTLAGAWSSLKDFISQAAGGGTGGAFHFLQKILAGVDSELANITKNGKAATLTNVAEAFDKRLSPSTHLIINVFILLQYTLKGLLGTLFVFFKTIQILLWPLARLFSLFGANRVAMKLLGIVLGVSIGIWAAYKVAVITATIVNDAARISTIGLTTAQKLLRISMIETTATTALSTRASILWNTIMLKNGIALSKGKFAQGLALMRKGFLALIPTIVGAAAASWAFTASLLANPITWIVAAVLALTAGLVILYFRWKPFHDIVNSTAHWFHENWWWAKYFMGVFSTLGSIVLTFVQLYNIVKKIYDLFHHPISKGGIMGLLHSAYKFANPVTRIPYIGPKLDPFTYFPHHRRKAGGGYASGWNLVGEQGPEVVKLPGSSRVFNKDQMPGLVGGGGFVIRVMPQAIYFDRQKIGEVVARVVTDREARL